MVGGEEGRNSGTLGWACSLNPQLPASKGRHSVGSGYWQGGQITSQGVDFALGRQRFSTTPQPKRLTAKTPRAQRRKKTRKAGKKNPIEKGN
jgi:hypothetical protein